MPVGFRVELPIYEGPMELLVELVERQEVELAQVDVALVCDEFLAYVGRADELELDLAGEFLVMAATLVELKARLLFPRTPGEAGESRDAASDLLEQIALYKRFKDLAETLREMEAAQLELFPRGAPADFAALRRPLESSEDLALLVEAYGRLVPTDMDEGFLAEEKVTIAERMEELETVLRERGRVSLGELIPDRRRREYVVVTFLALLELVRMKRVRLAQGEPYLRLWIVPTDEAPS
jgi:segregation and condensation protein A